MVTLLETFVPRLFSSNSFTVLIGLLSEIGTLSMDDLVKPGESILAGDAERPSTGQEVRCAVRFPLTLPVVVSSGDDEHTAVTRNVSASGVLFEMNGPMKVGEDINFSLRMPGAVLGTPHDILVHCIGRVVRCSMSQSQSQVAATIDEYEFVEQ
jgi:hypothetical protein